MKDTNKAEVDKKELIVQKKQAPQVELKHSEGQQEI
jgi:hypothetical protein